MALRVNGQIVQLMSENEVIFELLDSEDAQSINSTLSGLTALVATKDNPGTLGPLLVLANPNASVGSSARIRYEASGMRAAINFETANLPGGPGRISLSTGPTTGLTERLRVEGDSRIMIEGGARLLSLSATEIGIQVTNDALTVGSAGALQAPRNAGALSDAVAGDADGCCGVDTTNHRWYVRSGGTWKSVAVAGFQLPKYGQEAPRLGEQGEYDETLCPLCQAPMRPGEPFALVGDRYYPDGALHAYACHLRCAQNL